MAETKWCSRCEQEVPISDWYRNAGRLDGLSAYCRTCYNAMEQERRRADRVAFLVEMGGRCERCGFDDPRALQVDHIDGRNGVPRGASNSRKFYREVLARRADFALLCANCNVIKRIENAEHGTPDRGRVPPTERIVRPRKPWTPERRAAQSERSKRMHEDPDFTAKLHGAPNPRRTGWRKTEDGSWVKPDE